MSAKVRSASDIKGSSERRCCEVIDDARDRKDGGGEDGIDSGTCEVRGTIETSSSSFADTYAGAC